MTIDSVIEEYQLKIDSRLEMLSASSDQPYDAVFDAGRYSLLAGGKRIRPIILLEFYKLFGGIDDCAYNFACAVEMIHTYSLIHDDLPCMDNDDLRRGKPSCHKKFGEGMALLAGDFLLTEAFAVCAKTLGILPERVLSATAYLAAAAGGGGMIGGQVIDTAGNIVNEQMLFKMYSLKTCALIRAAAVCGVVLAGGDEQSITFAERYAENLGLAFQIIDDLLDVEGNAVTLGKPVGSDDKNEKTTSVRLLGAERCRALAEDFTNNAISALDCFDGNTEVLKEITEMLLRRKK
ncbi:MAG: polyprenyl synthetase family protein [Clostridia bacterium]|nr:polyprenyl synthetase family protein [Clostridia bacterium]